MGHIEFRLGLSGTGKSQSIANEIAREVENNPLSSRIFWVVPGVASYTSERRLLEQTAATVRAEVIHLSRLAEQANTKLQATTATPVNNTGKRLLLAAVYKDCVSELQVLHRAEPSIRFLDSILEVFEELSEFALVPEQIEAQLEVAATRFDDIDPLSLTAVASKSLIGKLRDISLMYVRWKQELRIRHLYDASDLPALVTPHLDRWSELPQITLYIDGFSDICPRDALFIAALAQRAAHTVITLPLRRSTATGRALGSAVSHNEDGFPWDDPLILQGWMSFRRLTWAAAEQGLQIDVQKAPVTAKEGRFKEAPDLSVLAEFLAGERTEPADWQGQVFLAQAQNSRAECDGVAASIARYVQEESCGFEDIAVLVPDMELYSAQLAESFHAYGIPFSMDTYPPLANHPLTKFLLASLVTVDEDLSVEAMKRYLKTEFCGLTPEDGDWLETYIQSYEVEGRKMWLSPERWGFAQAQSDGVAAAAASRADERAESLRQTLLSILQPFVTRLSGDLRPAQLAQALWELLVDAGAKRKVAQWLVEEGAGAAANPGEGSLHEQAWMKWMSLLNDLSETRAGIPMPRSFLFSLVYEECMTQSLTTIPEGLHQVRVLSFAHAIAWEASRVFVMGAADGVLPGRVLHRGLLQDEERIQFAALFDQRLGYTTQERQGFQRMFVYSVLSRSSEHLVISSPLSNQDGKAIRPSLLFAQIQEWFNGQCSEVLWTREDAVGLFEGDRGLANIQAPPGRLLEYWLPRLKEGTLPVKELPQLQSAMLHYLENHPWRAAARQGVAGLSHQTQAKSLPDSVAKQLYGTPLYTNVHQLETYASCSYRYFLQYGLRLQPEDFPEITPAERGTLIHDVLQEFVAKHMDDPSSWRKMADADVQESIRRLFDQVLERPTSQIWARKASRRQQALEALLLLERAAVVLTNHVRRGEFVPRALELSFGTRAGADGDSDKHGADGTGNRLPLLKFALDNEVEVLVRGRVDRVDTAAEGNDLAIRIIDYKSSALDLDITRIEYGLRLQLPLYGAALVKYSQQLFGQEGTLAGLLYLPIQSGISVSPSPMKPSDAIAAQAQHMRTRGWMLANDTYLQWMDGSIRDGATDLFKKVYKKDGSLMKTAPVLTEQAWQSLLGRVISHVYTLSSRILSGKIPIQPYRFRSEESCTFCPYSAVCHIDKRWDPSPFRNLSPLNTDDMEDWTAYTEHWHEFISAGSDEQ
ncbi:PD-(D/E)XK nuclease family protein [Alicyclobacillus sp. SO9]|uniref:PD-(D/E)XK nuclease family protein n=1 Tax=Alicyclobacillus sp. SO9 TaxID=2665646 RepID=UPI0018E747D3|nr:PD-(D/E)XK nuclease family protein [Alicyclobacillus sp. SO9]QQE77423.1 PD-(D/E)XK nuclease family protein [Alicyclobacillus sp. SO9]